MSAPWLKVTHIGTMPGESFVSQHPKKRPKRVPGRWVVFDKNVTGYGPVAHSHVISDHATFEEAAAACRTPRA